MAADPRHMSRVRRRLHILFAAFAAAFAVAQLLPATSSSFTDTTANSGNTATAVPDWTAPTVSASAIQKSEAGYTGRIHQGGTFYVYANASDSGNPASGVASVSADVSTVATVSSASMSSTGGPWTVGGVSYAYRSSQLTAKATLAAGTYSWTVAATDSAGNGPGTAFSNTVSVDNTAYAATGFTTANKTGGNAGKPEQGDKVTFTYSRAPEPDSIYRGWDGTSTTVTVAMADGGLYGLTGTQDLLAINDPSGNQLGFYYVRLNGDYVPGSKTLNFTGSTMTLSGSTATITFGTADNAANEKDDNNNRAPTWFPSASVFDWWGNTVGTTSLTPTARVQF